MSKQHIAILSSYSPSIVSFRGPLIDSLIKAGHSVTILAPQLTSEIISQINAIGASAIEVNLSRRSNGFISQLLVIKFLYLYFRRNNPDIVLTYFLKPNIYGIILAFIARVPKRVCMIEGLGFFFTPNASGARPLNRILISEIILLLYKLVFRLSHTVITLNNDDTLLLQKRCGLCLPKILRIKGIGIRINDWPFLPSTLNPITFTFVGRLLVEKGIIEFLTAASAIKSRYPNCRFLLLGDFDDNPGTITYDYLRPFIENNIVEWLGHVQPLPYFKQTSVFVLPSYREGFPRSTQEAMSCGLPVITTNVPGCRESVIEGINGFIVQSHSSKALVQAMLNFIYKPLLIKLMGEESRKLASYWFDHDLINKKIISRLID